MLDKFKIYWKCTECGAEGELTSPDSDEEPWNGCCPKCLRHKGEVVCVPEYYNQDENPEYAVNRFIEELGRATAEEIRANAEKINLIAQWI